MSVKNTHKISLNIFSHKYLKQGNLQLNEEKKSCDSSTFKKSPAKYYSDFKD